MVKVNTNTHTVQSLVFDIEIPHQAMAINIQERISHLTEQRLSETINRVLSEFEHKDQQITIHKITLDIGYLTNDEMFDELVENHLKKKLKEYLSEQLSIKKQDSANITISDTNSSLIEQVLYFLKHGHLPWQARHENFNDINNLLIELQDNDPQAINRILTATRTDKNSIYRLVSHINDKNIKTIIKKSLLISTDQLNNLLNEIYLVIDHIKQIGLNQINKQLTYQALLSLTERENPKHIFKEWLDKDIEPLLKKEKNQQLLLIKKSVIESRKINKIQNTYKTIFIDFLSTNIGKKFITEYSTNEPYNKVIDPINTKNKISLSSINYWYINNSGLILLWPYLGRYLKTIGLVNNSKFISTIAQQKALYELEYILHDPKEFHEYDLVLNKVLCGIKITATIEMQLKTGPINPKAGSSLLRSAIKNWPLITNTSIEGFKESFLSRAGKLIEHEKHWQLVIDRKGYDVLLEQLPYSLNAVKLPWMNKAIYVEW